MDLITIGTITTGNLLGAVNASIVLLIQIMKTLLIMSVNWAMFGFSQEIGFVLMGRDLKFGVDTLNKTMILSDQRHRWRKTIEREELGK